MNDRSEIVLVGQWRYPTESYSWEIPRGGSLDGETDLLEVARRELFEETGVEAGEWRELGDLDLCNGVLRSRERIYLATSLHVSPPPVDPAEPIAVRWLSLGKVLAMVTGNEIREATSVASILKAYALLQC
jgi:8-oxo-dGTP pyrophosphatase MutT (NUDIX family)